MLSKPGVMRRMILGSAAGLLPSGAHATADRELDLTRHELTFNENFDRIDVSARGPDTRWTSHVPWGGNFGDATFVDPSPSFPFTTADGILRIEARKDNDGRWRSGCLSSVNRQGRGFAQQFGYFEARAKMPAGEGVWPAFWLIGQDRLSQGSRYTAEIDILEHYGNQPERYSSAIAVWDRVDQRNTQIIKRRIQTPGGVLQREFNLFGVTVDDEWISFYFNRRFQWRTPTPAQHKQPMFILVNLALGSGFPIDKVPNPSAMLVDYVRVWAPKG